MDLNQLVSTSQQSLGRVVQRTPLTEKLLSRPPFKYLHDLITEILAASQLAPGLFSEEELDSNNIKVPQACDSIASKTLIAIQDKESKIAFLQKIVDYGKPVSDHCSAAQLNIIYYYYYYYLSLHSLVAREIGSGETGKDCRWDRC